MELTEEEIVKDLQDFDNLIYFIINKHRLRSYDACYSAEDMHAIGQMGLLKGIKMFDSKRGFSKMTLYYRTIANELFNAMRSSKNVFNVEINDFIDIEWDYQNHNELIINDLLKNLSELEIFLVKNHFDFFETKLSQDEVAKKIGKSKTRVPQMLNKAIEKMRKEANVENVKNNNKEL